MFQLGISHSDGKWLQALVPGDQIKPQLSR